MMGTPFLFVYIWTDREGNSGVGNTEVKLAEGKPFTIRAIREFEQLVRERFDYTSLVLTDVIQLDPEEGEG